jgi:hypothetical protein
MIPNLLVSGPNRDISMSERVEPHKLNIDVEPVLSISVTKSIKFFVLVSSVTDRPGVRRIFPKRNRTFWHHGEYSGPMASADAAVHRPFWGTTCRVNCCCAMCYALMVTVPPVSWVRFIFILQSFETDTYG